MRTVLAQHELVAELVRGDVAGRYRGSVLGLLWSLASPLLLLAAFTFVFGTVFQSRWGGAAAGHGEYALLLFPGILLHGLMAEAVNRAPSLVTAVPNYVKKVVFPLELLPLVAVGSALFHALIGFAVFVAVLLVVHGGLPVSAVALPLDHAAVCAADPRRHVDSRGAGRLSSRHHSDHGPRNDAARVSVARALSGKRAAAPNTVLACLNPLTLPLEETREA